MKTNVKTARPTLSTHEGGHAQRIDATQQLERTVMTFLLFENQYYESGVDIADRITKLVPEVAPAEVARIAVEARTVMNMRHAPLFLVREMARLKTHRPYVADTLAKVIKRADELAEFMALYFKDGRIPIAHSVRKGLDAAVRNFDEYAFGKYKGDGKVVKPRDVFRMVRPRPEGEDQSALWKKVVHGGLETPDTWEVALSANDGLSKQEKWTRLLSEKRLGGLALLRNLRNMSQEDVDSKLIREAVLNGNYRYVLPFRFLAAATVVPQFEDVLEQAMFKSLADKPKLSGHTVILVDVSGSMIGAKLSEKSDLDRLQGAIGVAMVGRELCEWPDIFAFDNNVHAIPPRRGFALRDQINSHRGGGTLLGQAVAYANALKPDRLIVISDEQSADRVPSPVGTAYMLNVGTYQNGVGYGNGWTNISGFSEGVFNYILAAEGNRQTAEVDETIEG